MANILFFTDYYIKVHVCPHTVAIFKLSRTCILSTSFSGTGSGLSRYANRPVGYKHRDEEAEMKWMKTLNKLPQLPAKSMGYYHHHTKSFWHEYWNGINFFFLRVWNRLTSILLRRFIATGFSAVHSPTRWRLSCLRNIIYWQIFITSNK